MVSVRLSPLLFVALSVLGSPAHQQSDHSASGRDFVSNLNSVSSRSPESPVDLATSETPSVVGISWNVITKDDSWAGGNIDNSTIYRQIEVLNQDFEQVGVSFKLNGMRRIRNATWFNCHFTNRRSQSMLEMIESLLVPNPGILNIYSVAGSQLVAPIGWHPLDGIVLGIRELPADGGFATLPVYGHALTMGVGHWAGLRKTFAKGCDPENDGVDDTPPHTRPESLSCEERISSCPGAAGRPEPRNNFMNFIPEKCMSQFTPGQIQRMWKFLKRDRGITPSGPPTLRFKPAYSVDHQKKQYQRIENPMLPSDEAKRLFASKGDTCIVVIDGDKLSCTTEAELPNLLGGYTTSVVLPQDKR